MASVIDGWKVSVEHGEMILTGTDRSIRKKKTCPTATLSTIYLTRIDLESNPGFRGERPATNYMSHGRALAYTDTSCLFVTLRYTTLRCCCVSLCGTTGIL